MKKYHVVLVSEKGTTIKLVKGTEKRSAGDVITIKDKGWVCATESLDKKTATFVFHEMVKFQIQKNHTFIPIQKFLRFLN